MLSLQPQQAHAQRSLMSALGSGVGQGLGNCAASVGTSLLGGVLSGVGGNLVGGAVNAINPLAVPVVDSGTQATVTQGNVTRIAREGCLDGIMYAMAKQVLNQIADSTLAWVESGFQEFGQPGNRGFIGDLDQFVANVGEQTYNQFVNEFRRRNQLCGPYRDDVLMSVSAEYYRNNPEPAAVQREDTNALDPGGGGDCLGGLGPEATEAFYNGNFREAGWEAFDYSVRNPEASPVGAFLAENERLTARIQQSRRLDLQELQQNNGWLSVAACPESGSELHDATGKCLDDNGNPTIEPAVQTPGTVVNNAINNVVDSDFRRLELADETNEIVGALMNQLVANIVGAGGDDSQGLFDPELADRTDPLGNVGDYGSGDGYRGPIPVDYMASTIEEQIELEEQLLEAVQQLPSTNELAELEARLNQCLLQQTFPPSGEGTASNPDEDEVEDDIQTLRTAKDSVFPATRNAQEEEREVGAQKINWVGNKLEWNPGETYGIEECGPAHSNAYKPSYVANVEEGTWRMFICVPGHDGDFNETSQELNGEFIEIPDSSVAGMLAETEERSLYRAPQNDVIKVDWHGAPFEWDHYDIFAKEFTRFVYDAIHGPMWLIDFGSYGVQPIRVNGTGNEYPVPGPRPNVADEEIENFNQILNFRNSAETNRYGSNRCDRRTVGQLSYVVKPNEEVWTYQRCENVAEGVYRFLDTGETSPAFQDKNVVNQIDQYVQIISELIGDEGSVDDSYQAPTGGPDNLYEFLHDIQRVTSEEEADMAQIQQTLDARFGRLESRFHTQADLRAAESALEQLNPADPNSLYSQLQSLSSANSCPLPDDWSPPSDGDGGDDSGGSGGLEIVSFNAMRRGGIVLVNWQANAESCQAESAPQASSWNGEVGTAGSRGISTDDAIQVRLICEEGGATVRASRYVPSYGREDRFGPRSRTSGSRSRTPDQR